MCIRLVLLAVLLMACMSGSFATEAEPQTGKPVRLQRIEPLRTSRLDLRVPKITDLLSQEDIDRALNAARAPDIIEEVEVEGRRERLPMRTPDIPGGIFAPFWALAHPTQAWRIFMPLPPDQAVAADMGPADATDSYRPPVLPPR